MALLSCLICQTALETFQTKGDGRIYHSCPDCQWIFLDKQFHPSEERQKQRYLQHENSAGNAGYVAMFEGFIRTCVEPFAPKGGALLDFGCGPEPVLAGLLQKRGFSVDTFDLLFAPDESYRNKYYDLIILTEVLEHLFNPWETLKTLGENLKPGGGFAVMTLFHPNDRERFSKWWYRKDSTHVSFYTLKTLSLIAENLGIPLGFSDDNRVVVLKKEIPGF